MKRAKFREVFRCNSRRQRGIATLAVSVGIALLMAVAAVGMMRSGMLEQKIAANDLRVREAQEIAEAGMEYAIASGSAPSNQCPSDLNLTDNNFNFIPNENILNQIIAVQTAGEPYRPSIRWCFKELSVGKIYFVRSQAEIPSLEVDRDPVVKAFVESWFVSKVSYLKSSFDKTLFFTKKDFCLSSVGGKNQSNPCAVNIGDPDAYGSEYGAWVVATGTANIQNLSKNNNLPPPSGADVSGKDIGERTAWEYAFDVTLTEAKNLAKNDPGKPFYYFSDGDLNNSNKNFTSSSKNPVIVIFDSNGDEKNCPKINGNIEIHGVVYINDPNNLCKQIGLGDIKLYGSLISDGNINKINGNPTFYRFNGNLSDALKGDKSFIIPGTWRDFEPQPQP